MLEIFQQVLFQQVLYQKLFIFCMMSVFILIFVYFPLKMLQALGNLFLFKCYATADKKAFSAFKKIVQKGHANNADVKRLQELFHNRDVLYKKYFDTNQIHNIPRMLHVARVSFPCATLI